MSQSSFLRPQCAYPLQFAAYAAALPYSALGAQSNGTFMTAFGLQMYDNKVEMHTDEEGSITSESKRVECLQDGPNSDAGLRLSISHLFTACSCGEWRGLGSLPD